MSSSKRGHKGNAVQPENEPQIEQSHSSTTAYKKDHIGIEEQAYEKDSTNFVPIRLDRQSEDVRTSMCSMNDYFSRESRGIESEIDTECHYGVVPQTENPKKNQIQVHGWMHKQGERIFKGPMHKSWKRRYFAVEGFMLYYFHDNVQCRRYFINRNQDFLLGTIDLRQAVKLQQSERLDLPFRGIEVHTKKRVWILCAESESDFVLFFNAFERIIITEGSGNVVKKELPNVREYKMKGVATYRFFYFIFLIALIVEIGALIFWFPVGIQPCNLRFKHSTCAAIQRQVKDASTCTPLPFNGFFDPPQWFKVIGNVQHVKCFASPPIYQWISYILLLVSEILSGILGAFYFLGMWKPIRRGAKYLDNFSPPFPKELWPTVDILLCHYAEPAEDTIATLTAIMEMDYPPHLLHVWICDDGYCKTKWGKRDVIPEFNINTGVIDSAGDLRQEVAQFMYDRVEPAEDIEVYHWRKKHSSSNVPTLSNPRVVNRSDCSVGSFRDDYCYPQFPHVTFVGRIKPPVHHSKAGNINNVLYNESANGKYVVILDNDMKPHPKFITATLPFFFDDPFARNYNCAAPGCSSIAKIVCASCKLAGVPEDHIGYCTKACFEVSSHTTSSLHRRMVTGWNANKKKMSCRACGTKIDKKHETCKKCAKVLKRQSSNNLKAPPQETYLKLSDCQYSDSVAVNQVGYVQTPQYFEDCVQLQLGDPCGHRNATFFDAAQAGMDGYECASFAGTNAIFRRAALDSVGGIQYGSLTEDAFTGRMIVDQNWKALYFRKDLEGEENERIRLAEGAVPDTVAASLAQRKRWAKGNFQILLRKKKDMVDPNWVRPVVELPKKRKHNKFMRMVFYINLTVYPLGSFPALFFYYIILCFLFTGKAPIYTSGLNILISLVPKIFFQGVLSALSNRNVENNDVIRSQQTWFSYAFIHVLATFEAFYWKITGKEPKWANTGSIGGSSFTELFNIVIFFAMIFGVVYAIARFFVFYDLLGANGIALTVASVFLGYFIASQLGPMVRLSIQEFFGWSHRSLTDHGNVSSSFGLAFVLAIVCVWTYVDDLSPYY